MKKKIALMVALGCIGASAASVNYDLLGRKGSKMNSPMVYKNIDYSKAKKNEQQKVGSSLENRTLAKVGVGFRQDVVGLEGIYTNAPSRTPYTLTEHHTQWDHPNRIFYHLYGRGYMNESNRWFFDVGTHAGWAQTINYTAGTTVAPNFVAGSPMDLGGFRVEEYTHDFANSHQMTSPYDNTRQINYMSFPFIDALIAKRSYLAWFNNYSSNTAYSSGEWGYTGVYIAENARPVKIDPDKDVECQFDFAASFSTAPEDEMRASRTYSIVKAGSLFSNVYVTRQSPADPTATSPQMFVGLHNDKGTSTSNYSEAARVLDNYIYQYRTVEIVAAGNSGATNGNLEAKAHAVNAITVGAIDFLDGNAITNYTSWNYSYSHPRKPEIYNFSDFYMNDKRRTYTKQNTTYTFQPFYDGTEAAAAYTTGMVSDLLSVNPFYRRHPEVVKAVLLASGDISIDLQNYSHYPATNRVPTYYSVISDRNHTNQIHQSRYWVGDFNKIKTYNDSYVQQHGNDYRNQIRFSVKTSDFGTNSFSAAIAWLSSGDDVVKCGKIPQDFDLKVYASNDGNVDNIDYDHPLDVSQDSFNSYERMSFMTNANYLVFVVLLWGENQDSDNKGQIVMGFDVTSSPSN